MYHQHAHAVREVFMWHGVRLQRGMVLTDADVHELELPENAELLRRCTRTLRSQHVADEVVEAPKPFIPFTIAPTSAAAPVKE